MKTIYCHILFNGKVEGYSQERMNDDQIKIEVESNFRFEEGYKYVYKKDTNTIEKIILDS